MRGSISTIARSDTIWETVFVETWGEAFLNKVSSSIIGDPTGEGAAADTEEEAPGWMREPARLSSAQEEVMQACAGANFFLSLCIYLSLSHKHTLTLSLSLSLSHTHTRAVSKLRQFRAKIAYGVHLQGNLTRKKPPPLRTLQ